MNNINGEFAVRAAKFLKKHIHEIEEDINVSNEEYFKLLSKDHRFVGKLIINHLVVEYYINKFISHYYKTSDIVDLGNLSFYQKIYLLPKNKFWWPNFLDGLREFNSLRNKFAHKLDYCIQSNDMANMKKFIQWFMKDKYVGELEHIKVVEEFTKLTFGFLRVQPENIQNIFNSMVDYGLGTINEDS